MGLLEERLGVAEAVGELPLAIGIDGATSPWPIWCLRRVTVTMIAAVLAIGACVTQTKPSPRSLSET